MTLVILALAASAGAYAQGQPATAVFQYVRTGPAIGAKMIAVDGFGPEQVTGKPFSALEERHSLQVLGDGTRIENKDSNKIFRDAQGRTRIERSDGTVTIHDAVEGTVVELNLKDKTVRHSGFKMTFVTRGAPGGEAGAMTTQMDKLKVESLALDTVGPQRRMVVQRMAGPPPPGDVMIQRFELKGPGTDPAEENLGVQFINGVSAEGRRSTVKVAAGEIGNDRPLQVVSERWFSSDLGMTVKTSNSDPRFGETTYEMVDIVQGAQDPSLFQAPADFTERK